MEKNVSKARFIVPSVIGIFLFMIPIKVDGSWTIAVKIIADWISAIAESILPDLCLFRSKYMRGLFEVRYRCGAWVRCRTLDIRFETSYVNRMRILEYNSL